MNKKYLLLIVVLLWIAVFVAGCGGRDLSKPSARLIGHWGFFPIEGDDDLVDMEEYFGEFII